MGDYERASGMSQIAATLTATTWSEASSDQDGLRDEEDERRSSEELANDVFTLLKLRGPLCSSQLAADIGVSIKRIEAELRNLKEREIVERIPDRDNSRKFSDNEVPWGLRRLVSTRFPRRSRSN